MKQRNVFKRVAAIVLLVVLAVTVAAGCSKQGASSASSSAKSFKVALLLPGTINDQGWNASAYNGLNDVKKTLGVTTSYMENVQSSDFASVFRQYASQGYNLIIGHGSQFADAAKTVAKDFPKIEFLVTSTSITQSPNLSSVTGDTLQQGFLAGALAAQITQTKKVGAVGGQQDEPIINFIKGFELGAKYMDPSVKVLTAYTGSYTDAGKANETATAMITQGADVVTQDANQAGLGVIQAAKDKNIMDVGEVGDQSSVAPNTVVTSVLEDIGKSFVNITQKAMKGELKAQTFNAGVNEGTVDLLPYKNFDSKVSKTVKDKMTSLLNDMKSGKLDVHKLS